MYAYTHMYICIYVYVHTHCYHLVDLAHELSAAHSLRLPNLPMLQKGVHSPVLHTHLTGTFLSLMYWVWIYLKSSFLKKNKPTSTNAHNTHREPPRQGVCAPPLCGKQCSLTVDGISFPAGQAGFGSRHHHFIVSCPGEYTSFSLPRKGSNVCTSSIELVWTSNERMPFKAGHIAQARRSERGGASFPELCRPGWGW